jgi:hypothetical protein
MQQEMPALTYGQRLKASIDHTPSGEFVMVPLYSLNMEILELELNSVNLLSWHLSFTGLDEQYLLARQKHGVCEKSRLKDISASGPA